MDENVITVPNVTTNTDLIIKKFNTKSEGKTNLILSLIKDFQNTPIFPNYIRYLGINLGALIYNYF